MDDLPSDKLLRDDSFLLKFKYLDISSTLLETTMSRRSKPKVQQQPINQTDSAAVKLVCCFCGLSDDNEIVYGKFYQHDGIVTHYYCLLLSSNMEQRGSDEEGILGFLTDDIHKEVRRGKRLVCSHCKKNGATLGCCNGKCKRIFHFPCGIKAGSLHQFFGQFKSYCINHRPKQDIDQKLKNEVKKMSSILCYICYESVIPLDITGTLWAPCCKKNAWFHRTCVQQLAMSAGYFFKCPLCNNNREFQLAMLEHGIYIPKQDASWELVPNAFQELLYRHNRCDARTCLCSKGRTHTSSNPKWELVLCQMCGSQGTHVACSALESEKSKWECEECLSIISKSDSDTTSNTNEDSNVDMTRINMTVRECNEDSNDSDISVGKEPAVIANNGNNIPTTVSSIRLRPGPRSFKLQQVEKLKHAEPNKECTNENNFSPSNSNVLNNNSSHSNGNLKYFATSRRAGEVICIDSDDEAVEILCESVMRKTFRSNRVTSLKNNVNEASSSSNSSIRFKSTTGTFNASTIANTIGRTSAVRSNRVQPAVARSDDPAFNIVISNVTSVPPEFFSNASEPQTPELPAVSAASLAGAASTTDNLKRNYPADYDENDSQVVLDTPKRARLDGATHPTNKLDAANISEVTRDVRTKIARVESVDAASKPNVKESSSKAAKTALVGSNGAPSSLESCHGRAGTRLAMVDTRGSSDQDCTAAENTAGSGTANNQQSSGSSADPATTTPANISELAFRSFLENGSSSHCSSSGGSGGSSESGNSSFNRTGLIPDIVRLKDLKFKAWGNDLEILYHTCKIQLKLQNNTQILSNDAGNVVTTSGSTFAGSNQNVSNEKSSKSFPLRSDDSDESNIKLKSTRVQDLRNFVYEDDNTLLEYPTSVSDSQNNIRLSKKPTSAHDRNSVKLNEYDLKENWDPEVSESTNNMFDNSNDNQANYLDSKDKSINSPEKLSRNDDSILTSPQKEDLNVSQRSLRRSCRTVRHFRSVQNDLQNDQITRESIDTNIISPLLLSPPLRKSNQTVVNNQPDRTSKPLKTSSSVNTMETDKHLRNVDLNKLRFMLVGGLNGTCKNDIATDICFKVSIDLNKIRNLISAKPDLFFKTKNKGVRRWRVYRIDEKLIVEFKPGEKKFIIKSQSFDSLPELANDNLSYYKGRSKSLNNLSQVGSSDFLPMTDKEDCAEKISRRSQRRKTFQLEKYESVR